MKLKQAYLAALTALIFAGCVSEQERREALLAQTMVADIRSSLAAKDFEKAERLCDAGPVKCPTSNYDWLRAKANVIQQKQAVRQEEFTEWKNSDDGQANVSLEEFETKYKIGWRERAETKKKIRLVQEAKVAAEARRKAELEDIRRKRETLIDSIATKDLESIRDAYSDDPRKRGTLRHKGRIYACIYPRSNDRMDWLSTWTESRIELSKEDKLAGEALLSEFGMKYLPNAYANYEKVRDRAIELQQVFNEEFPQPCTITAGSPKWNSFNKVLEKLAKARAEYFLCHDELCHYWMKQKFSVLSAEELTKIDSQKLAVRLLPENVVLSKYTFLEYGGLDGTVSEFTMKYAPETFALYQKLEREMRETDVLLREVFKAARKMDSVRFDRTLDAAVSKRQDIVRVLNEMVFTIQAWNVDHRTMEKSSEDIAKCDQKLARELKPFADRLPTYVKDRTLGPVVAPSDMVKTPTGSVTTKKVEYGHYDRHGRWKNTGDKKREIEVTTHFNDLYVQRFEVTQLQWMIVMGNNPVLAGRYEENVGADHPIGSVSWEDCQTFVKKLNAMDGTHYRLPKLVEWKYACRAGSTRRGHLGKRKHGGLKEDEWGTKEDWNAMAWHDKYKHHAVGLKEPNAWNLYDMNGNVGEWCEDEKEGRGHWVGGKGYGPTEQEHSEDPLVGFRLVSSKE